MRKDINAIRHENGGDIAALGPIRHLPRIESDHTSEGEIAIASEDIDPVIQFF